MPLLTGVSAIFFKDRIFRWAFGSTAFCLHELQRLADSDDDTKRNRGRRGLEILRNMQKILRRMFVYTRDDLGGPEPVDLKLVKLAKVMEARICTTDFNLSRMASIQGVEMLNLNDLVNAVKPMVLPVMNWKCVF